MSKYHYDLVERGLIAKIVGKLVKMSSMFSKGITATSIRKQKSINKIRFYFNYKLTIVID